MPNPVDQDRLNAKTQGAVVIDLAAYKAAGGAATAKPADEVGDLYGFAAALKYPLAIFFAALFVIWFARRA